MVELRKRKAPAEPAPPAAKKPSSVKSVASKVKEAVTGKGASNGDSIAVGQTIALDGFGGEVETHDGTKTTLKALVDESKGGVVVFTYPKASTPGCTKQACLFRDDYTPLTSTGFSIFGLSSDSPKSNTTFKTKQNLPYTLLCDPNAALIGAIGLKKAPKGTTRGVFVVDKEGKVLAAEPGGPDATIEVVRKLIMGLTSAEAKADEDKGTTTKSSEVEKEIEEGKMNAQEAEQSNGGKMDEDVADVAADVADSAQKLDSNVQA